MNYKYTIVLVFLLATYSLTAQGNLDQSLNSVAENNRTLIAANQYVEAKKLEFRTGISPENPFVSADYMIGTPVAGGNQLDFQVTQAFDFPSVYFKKGDLADQKEAMLAIQLQGIRQDILLDAKATILEIIHLNKQFLVFQTRVENSASLVDQYQKRYDAEDISALELNKAKIQLLTLQSELRSIENETRIKIQHMTELNGGNELLITGTEYPLQPPVPLFEILEDSIEANDPGLKTLHQQREIYLSELSLNKAMAFPKFETGYHYQSVLGQTFNGVHLGISIPLWERRKTIKAARANVQLGDLQVEEHGNEHYFEIKELYQEYENLKQTIDDYRQVLGSLNSEELLQKLLESGDINFITYSAEIHYYYAAHDALAELEMRYHIVLAELFKYQL
ncbi:MAG: TolC family protein [Crocinitomicaceae bacterium]|nr:TolC family protein [Crocinitomicaceae bacterium]